MSSIKKSLIFALCVAVVCFAVFGLGASPVQAEVRHQGSILQDTVWSSADNPHLLESDVYVPDGVTLTIQPGVVLGIAPESDTGDIGSNPSLYVNGGRLSMKGQASGRISVTGIGGIFVGGGATDNGVAQISYADFTGGSRLSFDSAYGTVATSSIVHASMGIYAKDSVVSVWGSRIEGNEIGVYFDPHSIFQVRGGSGYGTGGEGNAFAMAPDIHTSSSLTIRGSIIRDNTDRAVSHFGGFTADAGHNWWGDPTGPAYSGYNSIRGDVEATPWLTAEPDLTDEPSDPAPCCSSILFLPGLEGSRLFTGNNQLWEPNRNADVDKLKLDVSGSSTDRKIYAGGPIDKAFGFMGIYARFMGFMDGLVKGGKVSEWRAFGYDWRKPIPEVVAGAEKRATTTENLIAVAEGLAARSLTGKVSIIAHSNGGLVAKYLVKSLEERGKQGIVDSVISVAVPYLGTPEAVKGLLEGQSLLGGVILKKATSLAMALNMPSAYSLLPSGTFFSRLFGPSVAFASTTDSVDTYPEQASFMKAHGGNDLLLRAADWLHGLLDPWQWPTGIARWALVGWNADTVKTVSYTDASRHTTISTISGDDTVVSGSAYDNAGLPVSIDLKEQSKLDGRKIGHMNILESSTTRSAIEEIASNPAYKQTEIIGRISGLPGVTIGEIDWRKMMRDEDAARREIHVNTHSPVKLHVYDSRGRHTGEVSLPPEILNYDAGDSDGPGVEEGLYTMEEEGIPGSSYRVIGCHDDQGLDCDTEVVLPDVGETYTAVVQGAGTGTFTLDIERVRATSTVEKVEWGGVPVTALSVATTTFMGDPTPVVPKTALASSTSTLKLDVDGDGSADSVMKPGKVKDSAARLDLLKRYISLFKTRLGHAHLRDLGPIQRGIVKELVEAFLKKFGRS